MSKANIKFFLFLCLFLFTFSLVSPAPPVTTLTERGVDIVHPETMYVENGVDLEINFWTYDASNGQTLTNTSLNCTLYIVDSAGVQFYRFSNQAGANGLIRYGKGSPLCVNCWTMTMPKENLSVQVYSYQIKCQGVNQALELVGGYDIGGFEVTFDGNEEATTGDGIFYFTLILVLVFFLGMCMLSFAKFDNLLNRVGMIGLSYLLSIALSFIVWNMALNFLTGSPFAIEMFRIIFIVLMVGLFPLLIGAFAWYFLMLWKIKEIQNLMDKGMSFDEAERRQGKKYK